MAGLLSIQLGNATNAKAVPLRLPSGDGDAVIGFAAVLSGVSNPVSGSKTPTLALRAATPGVLDPGKGLEAETSAVMASSDRFAFNPERASETLSSTPVKPSDSAPLSVGNAPEMPLSTGIKWSRSGASTHVAPAQTTSPHGQTSAASQNASPNTVTEGIAATLLPAPSSVVPGGKNPRGDGVGLQPGPSCAGRQRPSPARGCQFDFWACFGRCPWNAIRQCKEPGAAGRADRSIVAGGGIWQESGR